VAGIGTVLVIGTGVVTVSIKVEGKTLGGDMGTEVKGIVVSKNGVAKGSENGG